MESRAGHYLRLHQIGDEVVSMAENAVDHDRDLSRRLYALAVEIKKFSIERAVAEKIPEKELEVYKKDFKTLVDNARR